MSQIFLLTGENLYQIAEERRRWIDGFVEKFGEENMSIIESKSLRISDLLDEIATAPFIAEKRLVVLRGIPKMDKEHIQQIEQTIHPAVLLLIVEPKPDKRLSATKEILAIADVKTFSIIKGAKLSQWVQSVVQEYGSTIASSEADYLVAQVGEDQMLLATEIQKIATYATDRSITKEDIDLLVLLSAEQVGWKLMDLIAAGNVNEALGFAEELMHGGESPYALWSRITWMISQLVLVTTCVQEGNTNPASIAKNAGVPFPTARTLLPLARKIDTETLQSIVDLSAEADVKLKTGSFRSTVDATDEVTALVDSCIARVCTCA